MCGIAGIVAFDRPASASRAAALRMRDVLAHRGPDGEGLALGSHAALVHTRLAMVDREGGAQPMRSADGNLLLVYNGELYNDAALRERLGGRFHTRCDTETVLRAWERWGEGCLEHLDGMFALFVWDQRRQLGFAARDPLGVKPLLYRTTPCFAFASEAKALLGLEPGAVRADLDAVVEYLVAPAFSGVDRSMFEGIEVLPPGHCLRVGADGISVREHWRWQPRPDPSVEPQQLRDALQPAIDACARADAPVGVFLSGGLDSTLVAAGMRSTQDRVSALTITFEGQERWAEGASTIVVSDDTPFAELAARELDLEHHWVPFERDGLVQQLRALARVDDALPAWEQELSQRALARAAAARGLRGMVVGDAADETHYGYHFLLDAVATESPRRILERLGGVPIRGEVDADPVGRLDGRYRALAESTGVSFEDPAQRIAATTQLVVRRWLPRLLHNGDLHCMAFGVEPRVPFAARRVLELAQAVSPARALAAGVEKAMLRQAARGLVPEAIRGRRKSALPKDQDLGPRYRSHLREVWTAPHPLLETVVDRARLPLEGDRSLTEAERAGLFRVACLQHWAEAYGVAAP